MGSFSSRAAAMAVCVCALELLGVVAGDDMLLGRVVVVRPADWFVVSWQGGNAGGLGLP